MLTDDNGLVNLLSNNKMNINTLKQWQRTREALCKQLLAQQGIFFFDDIESVVFS